MRDDVSDPTLAGVEIAAVVLSVDYRHARVHFVLAAEEGSRSPADGSGGAHPRRGSAERALVRATPFLRARLADAIDMKRTPDLRFVFDGLALPQAKGAGGSWSE